MYGDRDRFFFNTKFLVHNIYDHQNAAVLILFFHHSGRRYLCKRSSEQVEIILHKLYPTFNCNAIQCLQRLWILNPDKYLLCNFKSFNFCKWNVGKKPSLQLLYIYGNRKIFLYASTESIIGKSLLFGTMQNNNPLFTSAFAKVKSYIWFYRHTYLYVGHGFVKVHTWIC